MVFVSLSLFVLIFISCEQHATKTHSLLLPLSCPLVAQNDLFITGPQGQLLFLPFQSILVNSIIYTGPLCVEFNSIDSLPPYLKSFTGCQPKRSLENTEQILSVYALHHRDGTKQLADVNVNHGYHWTLLLPFGQSNCSTYPDADALIRQEHPDLLFGNTGFMRVGIDRALVGSKVNLDQLPLMATYHPDSLVRTRSFHYHNKWVSFQKFTALLHKYWKERSRVFQQFRGIGKNGDDVSENAPYQYLTIYGMGNGARQEGLFDVFSLHQALFQEALVCMDFTGSMYGFEEELLRMTQELRGKNLLKHMVFFNDLNCDMPGATIGNFGGFYASNTPYPSDLEIQRNLKDCRNSGQGCGDLEENDLETIIKAIKHFPDSSYQNILLICDNNARPKDMALLGTLVLPQNKRLHIVVCRTTSIDQVQPAYQQLAKWGKGCLFTLDLDKLCYGVMPDSLYPDSLLQ